MPKTAEVSVDTASRSDAPPPAFEERTLSGWGRTSPSRARVVTPTDGSGVLDSALRAAGSGEAKLRPGVIARGLGRSYGDAAQCAGGVVVDGTGLDTIIESDLHAGWVRVGAGVSLDALMRGLIPLGWFVPVSPGTRFVTVGGAIAADVHGKNHHRDGSFCSHVTRLSLATPTRRGEGSPH